MSVRAVRNNNPGNIRIGEDWQGLMPPAEMTPEQAAEREFCVFKTPAYGFRAMACIFHAYQKKHGIRTLREAISRWAPPSENNTAAYIRAVCDATRYGPDEDFPFTGRPAQQMALLKAVSIHEAGGWFFSQSDLADGVRMVTE